MKRYIHIRNWEKFQHKDLNKKSHGHLPWIKAYTKLLHDDDWLCLSHSQRGILFGLWLMYASSTQRGIDEVRARYLLSTNKAETRHFRGHLEALNHAGFIEFSSQLIRESVAPRVEKSREDKNKSKNNISHELNNVLVTSRLIQAVGPADEAATTRIRQLCERLPEGSVAKVTESLLTQKPRNRIGYTINALKSEAA